MQYQLNIKVPFNTVYGKSFEQHKCEAMRKDLAILSLKFSLDVFWMLLCSNVLRRCSNQRFPDDNGGKLSG